jgi:hypothetical protein
VTRICGNSRKGEPNFILKADVEMERLMDERLK